MIPQDAAEVIPALLEFLRRVHFQIDVEINLTEDRHQATWFIQFASIDFEHICDTFATQIGFDLLNNPNISNYRLYLFSLEGTTIRYAKRFY